MKHIITVLKALAASYLVTILLLLSLAACMYKMDVGERFVDGGITAVYILSCFLGGFLMGKLQKNRKFIWGMFIGCMYYAVLSAMSLIMHQNGVTVSGNAVTSAVICIASGMLGGMLS